MSSMGVIYGKSSEKSAPKFRPPPPQRITKKNENLRMRILNIQFFRKYCPLPIYVLILWGGGGRIFEISSVRNFSVNNAHGRHAKFEKILRFSATAPL